MFVLLVCEISDDFMFILSIIPIFLLLAINVHLFFRSKKENKFKMSKVLKLETILVQVYFKNSHIQMQNIIQKIIIDVNYSMAS